jgi:hypothetical protein
VHLAGRAEARMTAAKQAKRAEEIVDSLKSKEIIAKNRYLDKLATIEPGMPAASQAKSGLLRSAGGAVLKGAQKGAAGTIKGAEAAASGLFKATGHIGTGAVKAAGLAGEASDFALRNVGKLAKTGLRVAGTAGTIYEAGGMVNALAKDRSGTALAMRGSNLGAMGAMMAGGPVGWALGIGTTAAGLIEQGMAPKGDKKSALEWVEEGQEATRTSGAYAGQVGKYINETRLPLLDIIAKNPRSDEAKIARALDKRKTEQAANLKIAELKTKLESQGPISKLGDWLSRGYGPDSRQAIQRELADAKEQAQKSRTESFEELGLDPTKDRQKGIEDAIARLGGGKTREDQLLEYYKKKGEKDFESQTALGSTGNVTAFKEYGEIKKAIREGDKGTIQVYENKMNQGQKQARTINAVKSAGSSVGEFLTKLLRQDGKAPAATAEKDTKTMEIRKDPREEKITKAVRAVEDVKVEEQNKLNEQTHTVNQAQSRIESLQKEMQRIEQARQEIFHKGDATGKYVFGAVENQKLQILRNQEQKLQMAQKTGKIPERQLKDVPKPVQDRLDFLEKESETAKSERTKIHQTSGGRYNASTNKQLADLREREKQANDEQVRMLSENMGVPELPSVKTESPPDVRKSKQVQTPKEPNMPELELKYQSRLEGPMYPSVFNQPPPDVREAKQVQTPKEPKIAPINMPELKLKHQSKLEGPMYPSVFNQPMPQLEFSPIDHAAQQKSAPVKAAGASTSLSTTTGHPADMAQRGLEYAIAGIKGFGSVWTEGRDKVNRQPTQINSGGGYNA